MRSVIVDAMLSGEKTLLDSHSGKVVFLHSPKLSAIPMVGVAMLTGWPEGWGLADVASVTGTSVDSGTSADGNTCLSPISVELLTGGLEAKTLDVRKREERAKCAGIREASAASKKRRKAAGFMISRPMLTTSTKLTETSPELFCINFVHLFIRRLTFGDMATFQWISQGPRHRNLDTLEASSSLDIAFHSQPVTRWTFKHHQLIKGRQWINSFIISPQSDCCCQF